MLLIHGRFAIFLSNNDDGICVDDDDDNNDNDVTQNEKCKWKLRCSSQLASNHYEIRNNVPFFNFSIYFKQQNCLSVGTEK
jgi:hypothetical protein